MSPPDAAVQPPWLEGLRFVNKITRLKCLTSELASTLGLSSWTVLKEQNLTDFYFLTNLAKLLILTLKSYIAT
jgi:hypothetical protein